MSYFLIHRICHECLFINSETHVHFMLWNFLSPTIWGQEGIVCFVDIV
jgi:hypothetical protein